MPLLPPIIHCLIDAEPTRFHDSDVEGKTATFAANLSFEVPANRDGMTDEQGKVDETDARGLLAGILGKLNDVEFHAYLLEGPLGGPYTLSPAADTIMAKVSAPDIEANRGHVLAWLEQQKPSKQKYYWSSLDASLTNPEQELDAESAGASPRLRAAQAWNAPVGHRQGLTHLLRITPIVGDGTSKIYVVLPYLCAPDGTLPENVTVIPPASPSGDPLADWAASAIECTYDVLGGVDVWRCRTNAIGIIGGKPITLPPPSPSVDDALTADGFLVVNPDAENIRRYLKTFEERAASILMAANALHVDGKEDAKLLEPYFGFKRGTAPDTYTWGSTVWYVLSRLVSALDNHVLALLKPVAADSDKRWKHNSESEGDVLAPLVSLILEEMDDLDISGDARQITDAIRKVLLDHCPLVAGGPAGLLVPALRYIHGIKELETNAGAVKFDKAEITHLISSMLAQYQKGGDYNPVADEAKDAIPPLLDKSIEMLAAALLDLEQPLFDEAGAEQALIRLFETVGFDQNTTDLAAVLTSRIAENIAGGEPGGALRTAVDSAWANYKALLSGNFNGAEAIRRSVSASFTDALLKKASVVKEKLTALRLRGLTAAARFYKWRFAGVMNDPNCFEVMALPLVKVDDTHRPKAISMLERLDEAYARAVEVFVRSPKDAGRFRPDSFPQPLPIQIAAGIDGSEIDDFAKAFNGICVAIRRDEADGKWAYANLADLSWREKDDDKGKPVIQKKVSTALHPMLPAVADGRGPMFIDYEGFPFAEAADAERFADDVASTSQMLFYRHEPHDGTGAGFEKLPRLAYGRRFQSFGFAVSNAGVLPRMLQRNPTEPWMPLADIEQLFAEPKTEPPLFEIDYQRRTAIARMAVIEMPGPGKARRLGESIAGVQPLSIDYPRIGMVAEKGLPGVIDLFKESDGVPRMHLPEKITRPIEWQLNDLEWFGKPSSLTLGLFDRDPDAPDASGEFPTSITADLTDLRQIRLIVEDDGEARTLRIVSDKAQLNEHNLKQEEASYWLRLELTTDQMDRASLSFADPEGKRPAGEAAPLILLQPEDEKSKTWRTDLPKAISLRVSTPRVGYLDFTRWMANSRLRGEAYSEGGEVFELALLTAYYMRHLDPLLAQHLDNLPDPAVEAIRIELMQTDQLTARGKGPFATRVDLATPGTNLLADFVKKLGKDVAKDPQWTPVRLRKIVFEKLDEIFSFRIDITAGAALALTDTRVATIPAGAVAHLSMHTFVSDEHFVDKDGPAVFHTGLKQYATRQTVKQAKDKDKPEIKWLCYPAAAICIETMHDGIGLKTATEWINAADAMIEVVPASVSRRFDLKTYAQIQKRANRDDWRLISEVDVTTQRWRPTGRPIYHFIRPRMNPLDDANPSAGPVVPVATNDEVAHFENEAFFDRPDIDAQTVTQRLAPLGARTVLQEHPWDAPSATYFRHRFTLRSRYAGALQSASKRSVDAWPRNQKAKGWTKRVAMLADMSRLILTRPQLRALIPLTTAPGGETATAPVPPVAAILQEPPYSRGGLADRIAPELKTGFGYGFAVKGKDIGENDPPLAVEILDSRKEAGPSPQLSYRPFEINDVLGLSLSGEGPLGLTFDMPDAPAPAFANSMMSLRPISLTGAEPPLEEALMGVAMRRYLDPSWLAGPELASKKLDDGSFTLELPTERTWWIDLEQKQTAVACTWESGEVLEVSNISEDEDASHIEVKVSKKAIDGVAGREKPEVTIARIQTRRVAGLIVLHQPIAMGRYSTSILARSASVRVADGVGALPLILASFEWSIPTPKRDDEVAKPYGEPRLTISGGRATARETAASATTSLRWTQISRDFEFIRTFGDEQPHLARNLVARIASNAISFDLINGARNVAVSPSTFTNPYPSHVHRHIGLITSRYLPELGRPVEEFCRRALAAGPRTMLADATKGTEQAVRVVEFETPAMIVGDNRLALPDTYRQAYFDLVSTGYSANSDLILTIRFVGTETHLGKFKKLTVMLDQPSRQQSGVRAPIEIGIDLPKSPLSVGVRLILRPAGAANWAEPWLIQADGSLARSTLVPKPANPTLPLDFSGIHPGFMLELKADTQAGIHAEFWADISLLHLSEEATEAAASVVAVGPPPIAPPAVAFDFGWLFASDGRSEPAALVSPAGLATMKEAQARIISVSPPIPIV